MSLQCCTLMSDLRGSYTIETMYLSYIGLGSLLAITCFNGDDNLCCLHIQQDCLQPNCFPARDNSINQPSYQPSFCPSNAQLYCLLVDLVTSIVFNRVQFNLVHLAYSLVFIYIQRIYIVYILQCIQYSVNICSAFNRVQFN